MSGRWKYINLTPGFLILLPYLGWHVASAYLGGGARNMLGEGLQVGVVTLFAFCINQQVRDLDVRVFGKVLGVGLATVFAWCVAWHVSNGYIVGWKQFPDMRLTFVLLPLFVACLILFVRGRTRELLWFVWLILFPLIIMSGERKALLTYLFLSALLAVRGRLTLIAPVAVTIVAGLSLLSNVIENPYLQRQFSTFLDPSGTGNFQYLLETGEYADGDTPSNVQRAFAYSESMRMFSRHPILGVGTNQYLTVIDTNFPDLPKEMRLGIHGEFQRILTENGLLGLTLYAMIWIVALARLLRTIGAASRSRLVTTTQARILPFLLLVPLAVFVATEAPGTRSFLILVFVSLLPDMLKAILLKADAERHRADVQTSPSRGMVATPEGAT
jgi:hypothetical protein